MNKLVYGVGVNDLPYRTQVWEWVTKNGGKRIRKLVFYAHTIHRGNTC